MQVLWAAKLPATYLALTAQPSTDIIECYIWGMRGYNDIVFDPQTDAMYYTELRHGFDNVLYEHNSVNYTLIIDGSDLKLVAYVTTNIRAQTQMPPGYDKMYGRLTYLYVAEDRSTIIASGGSWVVKLAIDWTKVK